MRIEKEHEGTIHQTVCVCDIQGDMGEDTRLHLLQQPDGDVIVVMSNSKEMTRDSIEFCSSGGGGRYPWLTAKLREIIAECDKQLR